MNKIKNIGAIIMLFLVCTACNKEVQTPFDHPFFYIHVNNASEINIQANRNETVDYKVYFSTKTQFDPVALQYVIEVGNGLKEGVDFEILNEDRVLIFKPGFTEMPVRIRWISNPIDPQKDNSITIKLTTNDKNITVGFPGPDKRQSSFNITKI